MKIAPKAELINTSDEVLFNLLSDLNNLKDFLPQEKIENWDSTSDSCSFKIKGLAEVGLKKVASTPNSLIYLDSFKAPFKFTLNFYLEKIEENKTNTSFIFEANINPFMKMMLEKPLNQFFNEIIVNLKSKY